MALKSLNMCKLGFFLLSASHGVLSAFLPLFLKQVGLGAAEIGFVMLARPLGGVLGGLLVPQVTRKFTESRLAIVLTLIFMGSTVSISHFRTNAFSAECPYPVTQNDTELGCCGATEMAPNKISISIKSTFADRSWMYRNNSALIFGILYSLLVFCSDVGFVAVDTLQHSATMKILGKEKFQYFGNIRAFGALGVATSAVIGGLFVNARVFTEKVCQLLFFSVDYHPIFYVHIIFATASIANSSYLFQVSVDASPHKGVMLSGTDFKKAVLTLKNISWLMVVLFRSICFAVSQGFLNWHMENIGASPALIGLVTCITTITEFFMFFATPRLIEIFGQTKLVIIGLASYICRFAIYSFISNPVFIIPVEIMEGVMFACIWSSMVSYLSSQVPGEGQHQIQGIIQALQMLGISIGYPISGILTQLFGAKFMFFCFGVFATVTLLIFVITQIISSRDGEKTHLLTNKQPSPALNK